MCRLSAVAFNTPRERQGELHLPERLQFSGAKRGTDFVNLFGYLADAQRGRADDRRQCVDDGREDRRCRRAAEEEQRGIR